MNLNNGKHRQEIATRLRNFQYEAMDDGRVLIAGGTGVILGGVFKHRNHDREEGATIDPNLVVPESLTKLINCMFFGQSQLTAFYIALFSGNVEPDGTWTGANFNAKATEFTAYTPATRPEWDIGDGPATTPTASNSGNEALFTYSAGGPYTIYGAALLSGATKLGPGGTDLLVAATRFAVPRSNQLANDRLGVEYVFTAVDAG